MNKTVLVIGSVTAEQYQPVRLVALQRNDRPKIVRMSSDEFADLEEDEVEKLLQKHDFVVMEESAYFHFHENAPAILFGVLDGGYAVRPASDGSWWLEEVTGQGPELVREAI